MKLINEKETLKETRAYLNDFKELVGLLDKKTLDTIAHNVFNSTDVHFDELITLNSGFNVDYIPSTNHSNRSHQEKYIHIREKRINYIQNTITAIYELNNDKYHHLYQVMVNRYIYGYTIDVTAELMGVDPRMIRRWSREAELKISVGLETLR